MRIAGRPVAPLLAGALLIGGGAWAFTTAVAADDTTEVPYRELRLPAAETTTTTSPASADEVSSGIPIGMTDARLEATPVASTNPPTRLRFERLGIEAPVLPIGVDPRGEVAVPGGIDVTGWYRFGPEPGADGSAVVAAHVDFAGREGPFFRLAEAQVGDVVAVDASDGTTRTFRVTQIGRYGKTQLPTAELFRTSGAPQLALVTCGGDFDPTRHSYADNVVVIAVPT